MSRHYLCIEAGHDALYVCQAETTRKRPVTVGEPERLPLPSGVFGDSEAMAETLMAYLSNHERALTRRDVVLLANTDRTAVRVPQTKSFSVGRERSEAAQALIRKEFPYGEPFNETTHVFDYTALYDQAGIIKWFLAAIPLTFAECLTEMCERVGFIKRRIRRIDAIEHWLIRHYAHAGAETVWICLPQGRGIRVLVMHDRFPLGVYFINNDPSCRESEMERVCLWNPPFEPASKVALLTGDPDYDWIEHFFAGRTPFAPEMVKPDAMKIRTQMIAVNLLTPD